MIEDLVGTISRKIRGSALKEDILSVALFGSIQTKTERPASDVDLIINSLAEFKKKSKSKAGIIQNILKSYRLVYGIRLERLLK